MATNPTPTQVSMALIPNVAPAAVFLKNSLNVINNPVAVMDKASQPLISR